MVSSATAVRRHDLHRPAWSLDYDRDLPVHQAAMRAGRTAAQAAVKAGTRVVTVAYGAESSGCTYDTSPAITPCQTMEDMASDSQDFYSDYTAAGGDSSCVSASQPTTSMNQIFTDIATSLSVPRLIPNNTN